MPVVPADDDQLAEAFSKEAIFRAIMHYPDSEDYRKRRLLAAWFSTRSLVYVVNNFSVADVYSSHHIQLLDEARSVEDLGDNPERLHRRGFFAAHWLRYRLYAAAHKPDLGSNEKWMTYVIEKLLSELPQHWRKHFNTFEADRRAYAPVAHLWLAHFDERNDGLRLTPRPRPNLPRFSRLNMFEGLYPDERHARVERMYSRARAYFLLGQAAGLYGDRRGQIPLGNVWIFPDEIAPAPIQPPESPDLLVEEFDPEVFASKYAARRLREGEDNGEDFRPALNKRLRNRQPV